MRVGYGLCCRWHQYHCTFSALLFILLNQIRFSIPFSDARHLPTWCCEAIILLKDFKSFLVSERSKVASVISFMMFPPPHDAWPEFEHVLCTTWHHHAKSLHRCMHSTSSWSDHDLRCASRFTSDCCVTRRRRRGNGVALLYSISQLIFPRSCSWEINLNYSNRKASERVWGNCMRGKWKGMLQGRATAVRMRRGWTFFPLSFFSSLILGVSVTTTKAKVPPLYQRLGAISFQHLLHFLSGILILCCKEKHVFIHRQPEERKAREWKTPGRSLCTSLIPFFGYTFCTLLKTSLFFSSVAAAQSIFLIKRRELFLCVFWFSVARALGSSWCSVCVSSSCRHGSSESTLLSS